MSGPGDPTYQEAPPPSWQGEPAAPVPVRPDHRVAPPPGRAPARAAPAVVRMSFSLWLGSVAVGVLAIVYSMTRFDELRRRLADTARTRQPGIGSELLDRAVDITIYVGLGGAAVLILVQLLLAVLMRTRRNWARVLLAVAAVLGLVWVVFALGTIAERARVALPGQALMIVAATVLMFLPAANTWFRQRAA